MQFNYKARDEHGNIVEGELDAPDRFGVAKELRSRKQVPITVTAVAGDGSTFVERINSFLSRIKLREKIVFTHNLAGMLTAGLSLYRALEVQKKQNKNPALAKILDGLLSTVNQGGTLSEGMAKYPKMFSGLFVSMVKAGEESGNLSGTLNEVGSSLEKSYNLNRKVKGALMYPMIIVSAIFVIGVLMLIFVVPTLTKIFKDQGMKLPGPTQLIVTLSDTASAHPILFLGGMVGIFATLFFLFKAKRFKPVVDRVSIKVPAIGKIVREVNAARTARTLSSLLMAGVEMTRAIEITGDVLQNIYYKKVLARAGEVVQKGGTLSSVFKAETKLYPIMLGEMIAVGEETGALTQMLGEVAKFYEEEVDAQTKNLSTIIEPVLMVFIGAAVGFFAISMISPMYSLLNGIQ